MSDLPFFSVIIPVYNKLPHLERSISSALNQAYKNFEVIIVDDASTDGSGTEILKYKRENVTLLKRESPGAGGYAARNLGIHNAKHEWICFLDADDEWDPNLLEILKNAVIENKHVECLSWGWFNVNDNNHTLDPTSKINASVEQRFFTLTDFFNGIHTLWTGAVAFKKDLLLRAGGFPECGYNRGGDVDTWIRCLYHSKGNLWINKVLSCYYLDAVNMVTKFTKRETRYFLSPFMFELKTKSERKLVSALNKYQNERIYSTIRGQIIDGHPVDYALLKKLNSSPENILTLGKLLYNILKYKFKKPKGSA
jgi:glycosyltransferase involved in cell wall biosynthesis